MYVSCITVIYHYVSCSKHYLPEMRFCSYRLLRDDDALIQRHFICIWAPSLAFPFPFIKLFSHWNRWNPYRKNKNVFGACVKDAKLCFSFTYFSAMGSHVFVLFFCWQIFSAYWLHISCTSIFLDALYRECVWMSASLSLLLAVRVGGFFRMGGRKTMMKVSLCARLFLKQLSLSLINFPVWLLCVKLASESDPHRDCSFWPAIILKKIMFNITKIQNLSVKFHKVCHKD